MKKSELKNIIREEILSEKGDWFSVLSPEKQKEYIKFHPDSKYSNNGSNNNSSEEKKQQIKQSHIIKMKDLNRQLDQAEGKFNSTFINLAIPGEGELY